MTLPAPADVEAAVTTALAKLDPTVSIDVVADAMGRVENVERVAKEARRILTAALIEFIQERGPFVVGDVKYYLGTKKTTVCRDKALATDALLAVTGGDLGELAKLMVSEPYKPGACNAAVDEATFAALFEVTEKPELREGKPGKSLLSVPVRMLK